MMVLGAPTKASAQNGVGLLNRMRTVRSSTFSTVMSRSVAMVSGEVAGFLAYSQLKTTSSAVNGVPSCHLTPGLSFQVTDLPSEARPPFWFEGISAGRVSFMVLYR